MQQQALFHKTSELYVQKVAHSDQKCQGTAYPSLGCLQSDYQRIKALSFLLGIFFCLCLGNLSSNSIRPTLLPHIPMGYLPFCTQHW